VHFRICIGILFTNDETVIFNQPKLSKELHLLKLQINNFIEIRIDNF
jgi:hypothetical protein